jgi:MFS family permease
MTRIATSWLVYRLTGSAALLGVVGFAGQIPAFVLGPVAGVWVDRWDRHRTIVITQILSTVQSFALAVLALAHIVTVWEIVGLAFLQGLINAFDMPARQSFVIEMVERREDLGNAIALNSSMVNAARLIGPAIAGVLVASVGEGYCFLIDGISYIAVIVSLLMMRLAKAPAKKAARRVWHELVDGWQYVVHSVPIRSILLNLSVISLFGMPYSVLMPIFAAKVLGGGANTLGLLMAATGVGALVGAMMLAVRKNVVGLGRRIVVTTGMFGVALIGFALSRWLWLSLLLLPIAGFGMMQQMAASNTILQTIVDDEKRGRVMAFYSMAFQGMAPFGSLLAGSLAARFGAPVTVTVSGVACALGSVWFASRLPQIRQIVRPIYVRLGIVEQVPDLS